MLRSAKSLFQKRGSQIVTHPVAEPVSPVELQEHVVADDGILCPIKADGLIAAAREQIEETLGIAMITQTWIVALDRWPTGQEPWWDGVRQGAMSELSGSNKTYELPRFPLISVTGVNVYNEAGSATAVNVSNTFDIDTYQRPGRISLKQGAVWPVALRSVNAIEITYTAGFGATKDDVPFALRQAVMMLAGYLWEHRGECSIGSAYHDSGAASVASRYAVAAI